MDKSKPEELLRNLGALIRRASTRYSNEFIWQDVALTQEFKDAYTSYLEKSGYEIEFFDSSAVIITSQSRYIFVPNQWFVIASYVVDLYEELYKYKGLFAELTKYRGRTLDDYSKTLRDYTTADERKYFYEDAKLILKKRKIKEPIIHDTIEKLWRFTTDYSWWSGQKTIDRTDFHMSVILNLLNLVNASQSYVADITSAYANDKQLRNLVRNMDGFTINLALPDGYNNNDPIDGSRTDILVIREEPPPYSDQKKDTDNKPHIKIKENKLKSIKYKK
jgi:hypothetical protein